MTQYESFILLLSLAALFSYINHRFLKLPGTIGVTILALLTAIPIGLLELINPTLFHQVCQLVTALDFKSLLLDIMLTLLLFAGASNLKVQELIKERKSILAFATLGVLISTAVIGMGTYLISMLMGLGVSLGYALIFGALISPTDPIAALAILKQLGVNKSLESKIAGESLFNDGVGVVVFVTLVGLFSMSGEEITAVDVIWLLVEEAFGGIAFGLLIGYLGYKLMKSVDDEPKIDIMITLVVSIGGYALASLIGVSGPLSIVVAALFIGNKINTDFTLASESKKEMVLFWDVLDEILNACLFVLIGLEILILHFELPFIYFGFFVIIIVLVARYTSILTLSTVFGNNKDKNRSKYIKLLTWGGLRGAISIALALSLEEGPYRELIVFITYMVVVFSILVQGLTIQGLVKRLMLNKS